MIVSRHFLRALTALGLTLFGLSLSGASAARNVGYGTHTHVNRNVDVHYHDDYHPVARAAGVAVAAVAVGTIVRSLPPSCTTVVTAGVTYQNCGGTFYQPRYSGTQVTYVVVNHP